MQSLAGWLWMAMNGGMRAYTTKMGRCVPRVFVNIVMDS